MLANILNPIWFNLHKALIEFYPGQNYILSPTSPPFPVLKSSQVKPLQKTWYDEESNERRWNPSVFTSPLVPGGPHPKKGPGFGSFSEVKSWFWHNNEHIWAEIWIKSRVSTCRASLIAPAWATRCLKWPGIKSGSRSGITWLIVWRQYYRKSPWFPLYPVINSVKWAPPRYMSRCLDRVSASTNAPWRTMPDFPPTFRVSEEKQGPCLGHIFLALLGSLTIFIQLLCKIRGIRQALVQDHQLTWSADPATEISGFYSAYGNPSSDGPFLFNLSGTKLLRKKGALVLDFVPQPKLE